MIYDLFVSRLCIKTAFLVARRRNVTYFYIQGKKYHNARRNMPSTRTALKLAAFTVFLRIAASTTERFLEECVDDNDFKDSYGWSCVEYAPYCRGESQWVWGDIENYIDYGTGDSPVDACCACKNGIGGSDPYSPGENTNPKDSPTAYPTTSRPTNRPLDPNCKNVETFVDYNEKQECDYWNKQCNEGLNLQNSIYSETSSNGVLLTDACCACAKYGISRYDDPTFLDLKQRINDVSNSSTHPTTIRIVQSYIQVRETLVIKPGQNIIIEGIPSRTTLDAMEVLRHFSWHREPLYRFDI